MNALNVFFSEFVTVNGGGMKKEAGMVRAFFRNGKFTKIAKQGQFDIPILRRTLIGHIQAMNISTSVHPVTIEVSQVATADSYLHPLVSVEMLLRLKDDGGYRDLARLLTDHGDNIGTFLGGKLAGSVDTQVRQAFAASTSDDLVRASLPAAISIAVDGPALGALEMHGVAGITWTRDPAFTDALEARSRAGSLDDVHHTERLTARHEIELERWRRNNDEIDRRAEHQREMEKAQLDGLTRVAEGLFSTGRGSGKDFEKLLGAYQQPSELPPPAEAWSTEIPASRAPAIEAAGATAEHDPVPVYAEELNRDGRLTRAWKAAGLPPDVIVGCAASFVNGRVVAVFVLADPRAPMYESEELRPLEAALLEGFGAESATPIVLALVARRQTLIENYVASAARLVADGGPAADGGFRLELDESSEEGSDNLTISVSGAAAGAVRRALEDPTLGLLKPLEQLLSLDSVRVQLKMAE